MSVKWFRDYKRQHTHEWGLVENKICKVKRWGLGPPGPLNTSDQWEHHYKPRRLPGWGTPACWLQAALGPHERALEIVLVQTKGLGSELVLSFMSEFLKRST